MRFAPPSGSIARDRASSVERIDETAAGADAGADFSEAEHDCPARRLERRVEFVAGIAVGDSENDRGALDRALVKMA